MTKLVSLFNHKGGVSKTTTTFNLGWALADTGLRVLIVDGDPQCNLTGNVLGFQGRTDFQDFYDSSPNANIFAASSPSFSGGGTVISAAEITGSLHENLFLLAGHIDLAQQEAQLAVALSTHEALPALRNLPGALGHLLRRTAESHNIDIVLLDMSPSVGALNECLLMGSDYFIVPTAPDYFCDQAIYSLSTILPRWADAVDRFRGDDLLYPLPAAPQFIGAISQRYRPHRGRPAKAFRDWIERIKATINNQLVPALASRNMVVSRAAFEAASSADEPYNLANVADFNSLIGMSQEHNKPIFALSEDEIGRVGTVLENMMDSRDAFLQVFTDLAESVRQLVGLPDA